MASFEEHCEDCERELGKPYPEVHLWLDELFKELGPKHRSARHHERGVEECFRKWGPEGEKAAEIHIKKDCNGIVPSEDEAQMLSLFGPDVFFSDGRSFLTDEPNIVEYAEDIDDDPYINYQDENGVWVRKRISEVDDNDE